MNKWFELFTYIFLVVVLFIMMIGFLFSLIRHRHKRREVKKKMIGLLICLLCFIGILIFKKSHDTYYLYNDWKILGIHISEVQEQYGDFDYGQYVEGKKGKVGYYIYTDNGPIMPDYLKHFYYIEYDEKGFVVRVFEGLQQGG